MKKSPASSLGYQGLVRGVAIVSLETLNIVPGMPGGQAAYDAWVGVPGKDIDGRKAPDFSVAPGRVKVS